MDLSSWAEAAVSGAIPLALPVALLAGLVSFFSPCVVPLLPGYLAYATGMNAADIAADIVAGNARRSRAVIGTALFVLGFAAVFVAAGIVFGVIGQNLVIYQTLITRMVGVVTTVMGLIFAGLIP